jgi:hypothetical protein
MQFYPINVTNLSDILKFGGVEVAKYGIDRVPSLEKFLSETASRWVTLSTCPGSRYLKVSSTVLNMTIEDQTVKQQLDGRQDIRVVITT